MVSRLQGAIIAAGRGERLRSAVNDLPKPLVEIGGETMLVRQARMLRSAGAESVLAVINSETAALVESRAIALPRWLELRTRDTANSMESLFSLGEVLRGGPHFLLATVDAVASPGDLVDFTARARRMTSAEQPRCDGALAVVRWRGDARPLFVEISGDGTILSLGERESAFVTAGFYFLPSAIFDLAPRARAERLDAMRKLLGMAVSSGMRLAALELNAAIDVDEAADLAAARTLITGHAPVASRQSGTNIHSDKS
jgi:NDP-sugar pyrophosphorylase family protein